MSFRPSYRNDSNDLIRRLRSYDEEEIGIRHTDGRNSQLVVVSIIDPGFGALVFERRNPIFE
jgi:hypothetical protein